MNEKERILSEGSIDDKDLGEVTGGVFKGSSASSVKKTKVCPKCKSKNVGYTGVTEKAFFGIITRYKWHCGACGHDFFEYSDKP